MPGPTHAPAAPPQHHWDMMTQDNARTTFDENHPLKHIPQITNREWLARDPAKLMDEVTDFLIEEGKHRRFALMHEVITHYKSVGYKDKRLDQAYVRARTLGGDVSIVHDMVYRKQLMQTLSDWQPGNPDATISDERMRQESPGARLVMHALMEDIQEHGDRGHRVITISQENVYKIMHPWHALACPMLIDAKSDPDLIIPGLPTSLFSAINDYQFHKDIGQFMKKNIHLIPEDMIILMTPRLIDLSMSHHSYLSQAGNDLMVIVSDRINQDG